MIADQTMTRQRQSAQRVLLFWKGTGLRDIPKMARNQYNVQLVSRIR